MQYPINIKFILSLIHIIRVCFIPPVRQVSCTFMQRIKRCRHRNYWIPPRKHVTVTVRRVWLLCGIYSHVYAVSTNWRKDFMRRDIHEMQLRTTRKTCTPKRTKVKTRGFWRIGTPFPEWGINSWCWSNVVRWRWRSVQHMSWCSREPRSLWKAMCMKTVNKWWWIAPCWRTWRRLLIRAGIIPGTMKFMNRIFPIPRRSKNYQKEKVCQHQIHPIMMTKKAKLTNLRDAGNKQNDNN